MAMLNNQMVYSKLGVPRMASKSRSTIPMDGQQKHKHFLAVGFAKGGITSLKHHREQIEQICIYIYIIYIYIDIISDIKRNILYIIFYIKYMIIYIYIIKHIINI
jgi:hypothetical protein